MNDWDLEQENYPQKSMNSVVTVKDWFITMLILCIPIVNIIMMFVWAFGGGTKPSKENYFKAALLWALISIILTVAFMVLFGAAFMHSIGNMV